ncbi:MAG: PaaI family thioesterase [Pseudomonadota bacterium]
MSNPANPGPDNANLADAMPLARLLGVAVSRAGPQEIIGTLHVREDLCTAGDGVHGGTVMAFADSLAAIGAFLNLPEGATGTTTIESKTNFVGRAASGITLTGISTPVARGKRLSVWQTRIETDQERLVALVTQTQLVL